MCGLTQGEKEPLELFNTGVRFQKASIKKAEKKVPLGAIKWLQIAAMSPYVARGPAQIIA